MGARMCTVCGNDPVERVPLPDRNRVMRPDGTPIFLCDDCESLARAGQLGAFTNGSLLRLREYAPLFGIDLGRRQRRARREAPVRAPAPTAVGSGGRARPTAPPMRHALGHR